MPDETFVLCPACRRKVDPSEQGVHYAVKLEDAPGFGQSHDFIGGTGGYFHAECPLPPRWRPEDVPGR